MEQEKQNRELTENYHRVALYQSGTGPSDKVYALKKAYHRVNILARIQDRFKADELKDVLEFGPGAGCLADLVTQEYGPVNYTILDNNQDTLKSVAERFPHITGHPVEDSETLRAVPGTFDVIAAVDVWEHLPPDLLVEYTRWCFNALKPGGMMILQFPNWGCPMTASTFYSDLTHVNRFNELTVQQLFALVDIPETQYQIYNRRTPGFIGRIRDALMNLHGFFIRLLHILYGTVRLKFFAADLVVVIQKPTGQSRATGS